MRLKGGEHGVHVKILWRHHVVSGLHINFVCAWPAITQQITELSLGKEYVRKYGSKILKERICYHMYEYVVYQIN